MVLQKLLQFPLGFNAGQEVRQLQFDKIDELKEKSHKRKPGPLGISEYYSVLLPLVRLDGIWQILFQVRSNDLSTQPGEVGLPGGRVEPTESRSEAALRESEEELGVSKNRIELLTELDYLVTPYNLIIYAFAGRLDISSLSDIPYNPAEVREIFSVPLQFFLENSPEIYRVEVTVQPDKDFPYHLIPGGKDYDWRQGEYPVFFYRYDNHIIWGFTARLIRAFLELWEEAVMSG